MMLADQLNIDEMQAVGHIASLWAWAIDNAPDGVLPRSERMIASAAHWKGDAVPFVEACVMAGFIDDDFDATRELHDWEQWAGALVRKRDGDRERMRQLRHGDDRKTVARLSLDSRKSVTRKSRVEVPSN